MKIKKLMALALCTALALNVTPVSAKQDISNQTLKVNAEQSAEGMLKILQDNLLQNTDVSKYGNIYVKEMQLADPGALLLKEAQNFKANKKLTDVEAVLVDLNNDYQYEMVLTYPAGVRGAISVFRFDNEKQAVVKVKTYYGVTDYRKSGKKIVISQSQNAYSANYTTLKMTNAGKMKKVVTYSEKESKGKFVCKKNKKKITKKAFNKYVKKYNKLKRINFKPLTEDEIPVHVLAGDTYITKNSFTHIGYYETFKEVTVFSDNSAEAGVSPQNKYIGFWADFDAVEGGGYSSDGAIKRYVFGPDVKDAKTGKTYQQLDWEAGLYNSFDHGIVNTYISMVPKLDDKGYEFSMQPSEIENLKVEPGQSGQNGDSPKYAVTIYKFTYGNNDIEVSVFEDGEYAGRVKDLSVYKKGLDIPYEYYEYLYGDQGAQEGQIYDPTINVQVRGDAVDGLIVPGLRKISVNEKAADAALPKYEVSTSIDIEFNLSTESGSFYTLGADGKKQVLDSEGIADYNEKLNPMDEKQGYKDTSFENGIFWEPAA